MTYQTLTKWDTSKVTGPVRLTACMFLVYFDYRETVTQQIYFELLDAILRATGLTHQSKLNSYNVNKRSYCNLVNYVSVKQSSLEVTLICTSSSLGKSILITGRFWRKYFTVGVSNGSNIMLTFIFKTMNNISLKVLRFLLTDLTLFLWRVFYWWLQVKRDFKDRQTFPKKKKHCQVPNFISWLLTMLKDQSKHYRTKTQWGKKYPKKVLCGLILQKNNYYTWQYLWNPFHLANFPFQLFNHFIS